MSCWQSRNGKGEGIKDRSDTDGVRQTEIDRQKVRKEKEIVREKGRDRGMVIWQSD